MIRNKSCDICGHNRHPSRVCGHIAAFLTFTSAQGAHQELATCGCGDESKPRPPLRVIHGNV